MNSKKTKKLRKVKSKSYLTSLKLFKIKYFSRFKSISSQSFTSMDESIKNDVWLKKKHSNREKKYQQTRFHQI